MDTAADTIATDIPSGRMVAPDPGDAGRDIARVSVAVQHHPDRARLLPSLLAALPDARVVCDPDPGAQLRSPWRTYRAALLSAAPEATHLLVLQDDVEVCAGFADAFQAAVRARPDRVLCFFVAGQPVEQARAVVEACGRGDSWVELRDPRWLPAVAVCWPARLLQACVEWVDGQGWPPEFFADDEILGRFVRHAEETPLASVPSLVEHPDREPSLIHRDRHRAGADPDRVAACYIDPACDPAQIDWQVGPG